jgi:hypothetical protein
LVILIWSSLTTLNPFLNHERGVLGIVGRFDVLVFLQIATGLPIFTALFLEKAKVFTLITDLLCVLLIIYGYFLPVPLAMRADYLQQRENLIEKLPQLRDETCDNSLIIAQHGEQFLVTSILGISSQQKMPKENVYDCVYWLIHNGNDFKMMEDTELKELFSKLTLPEKQNRLKENPHLLQLLEVAGTR